MSNVKFLSDTYQASSQAAKSPRSDRPKLPKTSHPSWTQKPPSSQKRPKFAPIGRRYVQDLHLARTFKVKTKTKTKPEHP